jgi:RNA recognition motif-containing protein
MTKLFVGGFPLEITEMELAQLISPHGEVITIKIVRDKATRRCKGYSFIEMINQLAAENAIAALDGTPFGDRELSVRYATEKSQVSNKTHQTPIYKRVERTAEPQKRKRPRRQL